MYPWRYRDREMLAYAPDWDVTKDDYRHFTVDLSHAATSRTDAMAMVDRMGDRLAHVHLADGRGSAKDEHLVPGRGTQPCAELLERLALTGFDGHVVIEVNTRRAMSAAEREADLAGGPGLHPPAPGVRGPPRMTDPAGTTRAGHPAPTAAGRRGPPSARAAGTRDRILAAARGVLRPGLRQDVGARHREGGRGRRGARPPLLRHEGEVFEAAVEVDVRAGPDAVGGPRHASTASASGWPATSWPSGRTRRPAPR